MNIISKAWGAVASFGRSCVEKVSSVAGKACAVGAGALGLALGAPKASAQATDYGAVLETNLTTIDTIWGTVATIMIAVALVTVGVRFFRKAK